MDAVACRLRHRQQQVEHLLPVGDAEDPAADRREAALVLLLGARPQQRRERAEGRGGDERGRWRRRDRRRGDRLARRRQAVLLVQREDRG
jgi:hypothetical protein